MSPVQSVPSRNALFFDRGQEKTGKLPAAADNDRIGPHLRL